MEPSDRNDCPEKATKGLIADFQRFSLHDGPGIRITVFLKGCNMRCAWCHNPETVYGRPEYVLKPEKCIHCGKCAEGCFSGARVLCGKEMSVEEVMREIRKEKPYFGEEGGVTVSGGEPGMQAEFTAALLHTCKEEGISTVIETNMSLPMEKMEPVLKDTDLVLADLKIWDEESHKQWTGIGNRRIKENLRKCAAMKKPMILHTPVVCGVNDSFAQIGPIAEFAATLPSFLYYELLPYHPLGLSKGQVEHFICTPFEKPDRKKIMQIAEKCLQYGIPVRVAGVCVEERKGENDGTVELELEKQNGRSQA